MEISEYQRQALKTAIYPNIGNNIIYPVLGLLSEAGEVADKLKKAIRDNNGVIDDAVKKAIGKELGDVLWYVAATCYEAGLDMGEVAEGNLAKLVDRQKRNVLSGSGDGR